MPGHSHCVQPWFGHWLLFLHNPPHDLVFEHLRDISITHYLLRLELVLSRHANRARGKLVAVCVIRAVLELYESGSTGSDRACGICNHYRNRITYRATRDSSHTLAVFIAARAQVAMAVIVLQASNVARLGLMVDVMIISIDLGIDRTHGDGSQQQYYTQHRPYTRTRLAPALPH